MLMLAGHLACVILVKGYLIGALLIERYLVCVMWFLTNWLMGDLDTNAHWFGDIVFVCLFVVVWLGVFHVFSISWVFLFERLSTSSFVNCFFFVCVVLFACGKPCLLLTFRLLGYLLVNRLFPLSILHYLSPVILFHV